MHQKCITTSTQSISTQAMHSFPSSLSGLQSGGTALMVATQMGNHKMAKLLISEGKCNKDQKDKVWDTITKLHLQDRICSAYM